MTMKWQFGWVFGVTSCISTLAIAGCDAPDDPNVGVLEQGELVDDDHIDFTPVDDAITFRGVAENGMETNGAKLNGAKLNGVALTDVTRLGSAISGLSFAGGSLLSAFDEGTKTTRIGAQLAETVLAIDIDALGATKKVKIKSVVQSAVQPGVYFYNVQSEVAPGVFETICLDGAGNPTEAIPLSKAYDPTTAARIVDNDALTWACRGAALAKAIEWGYVPWTSAAMEDAHEAAIRMIRADYCGDGVTHTTNGNTIDVSDKWGIQMPDTNWGIEAKWGPNGAVCLNTPRKLFHPRSSIWCAASLPYCTDNGLADGTPNTNPAQYGGLLVTRAIPNDSPSAY